jgi:ribosomal protein S18 acetylase RimI-like enzyme
MARAADEKRQTKIVGVNAENVSEYGFFCVRDPKHPGYEKKLAWLLERFKDGLKIKLLFPPGERKAAGFIEYVPGRCAWRPVDAEGYMLIHCVFIEKRKYKGRGYGSLLVQECIGDAKRQRMKGVAVVASEGTWMASPELFLKNGFEVVDEAPPHFKLLANRFGRAAPPGFRGDWEKRLRKHKGLTLAYTHQCPFSARFLSDIQVFAKEKGLRLKHENIKTSSEAQNAACAYGTFTLMHNGVVVADHPISRSRFRNIVSKELKLI